MRLNIPGRAIRLRLKSAAGQKMENKYFSSRTMASALICNTRTSCLGFSSACIARMNLKAPASGWRTSAALSIVTAAASGRKADPTPGRPSFFLCPKNQSKPKYKLFMAPLKRILLAEDNENDVELTLAALEEHNLANEVVVARD